MAKGGKVPPAIVGSCLCFALLPFCFYACCCCRHLIWAPFVPVLLHYLHSLGQYNTCVWNNAKFMQRKTEKLSACLNENYKTFKGAARKMYIGKKKKIQMPSFSQMRLGLAGENWNWKRNLKFEIFLRFYFFSRSLLCSLPKFALCSRVFFDARSEKKVSN